MRYLSTSAACFQDGFGYKRNALTMISSKSPARGSLYALTLMLTAGATVARADVLYSDPFDTDTSANYNVYITPGSTGPSGDVTFAYNYGAAPSVGGLSIPVAPHTTDGSTFGLRLRTDNLQSSVGTVVGATEIFTKGLSLPLQYIVQVDVWSNYIGGTSIAASGSNGSTGVTLGIGSAGQKQYIASNDGELFEAFGDNGGGANGAYRVYTNDVSPRPVPTNTSYYAAGTSSTSASNTDPYYTAFLPGVSAPAGQSSFSATQGGTSAAGTLGFGWHTWTVTQDGTNVTWAIDGHTITTVPNSAVNFAGSQVSLGNDDTGLTGNSAANNQLFNAEIFDNFKITTPVPEPGSLGLVALAGAGLMGRRRRRSED